VNPTSSQPDQVRIPVGFFFEVVGVGEIVLFAYGQVLRSEVLPLTAFSGKRMNPEYEPRCPTDGALDHPEQFNGVEFALPIALVGVRFVRWLGG